MKKINRSRSVLLSLILSGVTINSLQVGKVFADDGGYNKKWIVHKSVSGEDTELLNSRIRTITNNIDSPKNSNSELLLLRDQYLNDNYSLYQKYVTCEPLSKEEFIENILNGSNGLLNYFNESYKNLSENEKLEKEVKLMRYCNDNDIILDSSGNFYESIEASYQLDCYLKDGGKDNLIKRSSDMTDSELCEQSNFLIDNMEDLLQNTDVDVESIVEQVIPIGADNLSEKQVEEILDKANDKAINSEVKSIAPRNFNHSKNISENSRLDKYIKLVKNLSDEYNKENNNLPILKSINSIKRSVTASSYQTNCLNYARKHGYTNGYYGSSNDRNDAPSPYYNYRKNGEHDCANFVSQCLRAGGVSFWKDWFFNNKNDYSYSWIRAKDFRTHWQSRVPSEYMYVTNSLSFLKPATPISILNPRSNFVATHTLITTDKHSNGYNFSYAAHSDQGKRTNLIAKLQAHNTHNVKNNEIKYYKVYW
ncbi:amidase domain-containing protein [Romboutsia lituseburensis]|uniref:Putative amidase domain-containing protein n=1 Tax=Romboutsia lituseburensis DSM 797 TaxID=1121325 RepID=A0A1G9TYS3_9FIRM|nr:amidase domain-containing protein [Romboutsia lituseburensis]CEH34699.1 Putative amidase domain [Romboutsia lituseburensis]SDM52405.1 Putative amidase domain-containing protein [Romboutsia lituseburensis DSM 797]